MCYSEVIMTKALKHTVSKAGDIGCPFQFHIIFEKAFLVFGHSFLYLECFGLDTV